MYKLQFWFKEDLKKKLFGRHCWRFGFVWRCTFAGGENATEVAGGQKWWSAEPRSEMVSTPSTVTFFVFLLCAARNSCHQKDMDMGQKQSFSNSLNSLSAMLVFLFPWLCHCFWSFQNKGLQSWSKLWGCRIFYC